MKFRIKHRLMGLFLLVALPGCLLKAPVRGPQPAVQPPPQIEKSEVRNHLKGVWENTGKDGKTKRMIFGADGALTFEGGLDYFNPAHWELDEDRHELRITLPEADDDKLQIFQMYIGDGVKAISRAQKEVTYSFTAETWSLNVAGWTYSKTDAANDTSVPLAEPVLK